MNPLEPLFTPSQAEWVVYRYIITHDCVNLNGFQTMVRDRVLETLRLTATDFESVVAAITPIPHIYLKPTSCLIAISSIGSWMMFVNPNPFYYAEQIDRCALLGIRQLRYLCLSHLSYARSLHSQLYHTWFYLSSVKLHLFNVFSMASLSSLSTLRHSKYTINIPIATPAANEPRQDNRIIIH